MGRRGIRRGKQHEDEIDLSARQNDAIATPSPGKLTFPIMQRLVRGGAELSEAEIGAAIAYAFKYLKLVLEPGGAAALAAALSGKLNARGKTIGVVLSGGNVDPPLFSRILAASA